MPANVACSASYSCCADVGIHMDLTFSQAVGGGAVHAPGAAEAEAKADACACASSRATRIALPTAAMASNDFNIGLDDNTARPGHVERRAEEEEEETADEEAEEEGL